MFSFSSFSLRIFNSFSWLFNDVLLEFIYDNSNQYSDLNNLIKKILKYKSNFSLLLTNYSLITEFNKNRMIFITKNENIIISAQEGLDRFFDFLTVVLHNSINLLSNAKKLNHFNNLKIFTTSYETEEKSNLNKFVLSNSLINIIRKIPAFNLMLKNGYSLNNLENNEFHGKENEFFDNFLIFYSDLKISIPLYNLIIFLILNFTKLYNHKKIQSKKILSIYNENFYYIFNFYFVKVIKKKLFLNNNFENDVKKKFFMYNDINFLIFFLSLMLLSLQFMLSKVLEIDFKEDVEELEDFDEISTRFADISFTSDEKISESYELLYRFYEKLDRNFKFDKINEEIFSEKCSSSKCKLVYVDFSIKVNNFILELKDINASLINDFISFEFNVIKKYVKKINIYTQESDENEVVEHDSEVFSNKTEGKNNQEISPPNPPERNFNSLFNKLDINNKSIAEKSSANFFNKFKTKLFNITEEINPSFSFSPPSSSHGPSSPSLSSPTSICNKVKSEKLSDTKYNNIEMLDEFLLYFNNLLTDLKYILNKDTYFYFNKILIDFFLQNSMENIFVTDYISEKSADNLIKIYQKIKSSLM